MLLKTVLDNGVAHGDIDHGTGDARHRNVVTRLHDTADHKRDATDDVADSVLEAQRDNNGNDAQGSHKPGGVHPEHRLKHAEQGHSPNRYAHAIHNNGGTGQPLHGMQNPMADLYQDVLNNERGRNHREEKDRLDSKNLGIHIEERHGVIHKVLDPFAGIHMLAKDQGRLP